MITSNGKIYEEETNDFFSSFKEIEVPKQEPTGKWLKGKMPEELWMQILGFFKWSYDEYKGETQIRLFFNTETLAWAAYPYKQEVTHGAMTTEDEHDEKARAKFPDPWVYLGTGHHHCSTSAFQSGTDHKDEINQDGVHFTIGKMDKKELDFHARISWNGEFFPLSLEGWIEIPEWVTNIPIEEAQKGLLKQYMLANYNYPFPEEWKKQVEKKTTIWGRNATHTPYSKTFSPKKSGTTSSVSTGMTTAETLHDYLTQNMGWTTSEIYLAITDPKINNEEYKELKETLNQVQWAIKANLAHKKMLELLKTETSLIIDKKKAIIDNAIKISKKTKKEIHKILENNFQHEVQNTFQIVWIFDKYDIPVTMIHNYTK